ncbi:hypothetical protein C2E23DRAFT_815995 [Lenzites betulinus]|nr:hypothetical protein C2E23DRAFT_815995 [Lenzites betulinus]
MATAASAEAAAQLLFPPNVQYNNSRLYTIRFLSSCFAGAVAGILGLENVLGFALFIFSTLFTAGCVFVKCKSRPGKYVPGGWWELVNPGQENIFSFVLVWTLFYGTWPTPSSAATDLLEGETQGSCTVSSQQHVMGLSERYQWNIDARSIRLNQDLWRDGRDWGSSFGACAGWEAEQVW